MNADARRIQRIYLTLTLLATLAASLIWGINTLFLLDAGLSNTQAFTANAFYTAGQVLFEVPTGVVADTRGRRVSYMVGAGTLLSATLLYLVMWETQAGMLGWAAASVLIGLGFTFFSGAVEAWLVDALTFTGFDGDLESVFAKGQVVAGVAMLTGSVAGGIIAQMTNLAVPYILRAVILGVTLVVAAVVMRDLGFTPVRDGSPLAEVRKVLAASVEHGWRNRPVRWVMLAAPFTAGVGVYAFYALQPYLLELYGDPEAFAVAGIAAAVVAGSQVVGGLAVPAVRRLFARRTDILLCGVSVAAAALVALGLVTSFVVAVVLVVVWGLVFAAAAPVRQAYINGLIPSQQRATVLSFDSLMGSAGGVVAQPVLGRVADVSGYGMSYVIGGALTALALPFLALARREDAVADRIAG